MRTMRLGMESYWKVEAIKIPIQFQLCTKFRRILVIARHKDKMNKIRGIWNFSFLF